MGEYMKRIYSMTMDDIEEFLLNNNEKKLFTTLKEREEQIKYIRSDEVSKDNLIEFLKLKKIFIPKESFLAYALHE